MNRNIMVVCNEPRAAALLQIAAEVGGDRLLVEKQAGSPEANLILVCAEDQTADRKAILREDIAAEQVEVVYVTRGAYRDVPSGPVTEDRILPIGKLSAFLREGGTDGSGSSLQQQLARIRETFLDELPPRFPEMTAHALSGGPEDLRLLRNELHRLAGTGGSLGLRRLGDLLRGMEQVVDEILETGSGVEKLGEISGKLRGLQELFPGSGNPLL